MKDKSYEQWLMEKEVSKRPVPSQVKSKPQGGASGSEGGGKAAPSTSGSGGGATSNGAMTTESIIRNIMKRREEEKGEDQQSELDYDSWYMNKEVDLLEQIRAGKTPLQLMLQKA